VPNYLISIALAAALVVGCGKDGGDSKPANHRDETGATTPRTGGDVEQTPETPASEAPSGPKGSIKGTVKFTGTAPKMPKLLTGSDPVCARTEKFAETVVVNENGTLRDVVVRVEPGTVPGWVPKDVIEVDQKDCVYQPRVQTGVIGQTIEVSNSDNTMHNVHVRGMNIDKRQAHRTLFNRPQPAGASPVQAKVKGVDVVKLKCDAHAWMQAYVAMSDQPYAAVTATDGSFEIKDVPAGVLKLQIWHQYYGLKSADVTVEDGKTAEVEYTYDGQADAPPGN